MGSHTYTYLQACYICPGTVPIPHYLLSSHRWSLSSRTAKLYHPLMLSLLCGFICGILCNLLCVWRPLFLWTGLFLSRGFYMHFTDWGLPQSSHWETGITNPWALFVLSWKTSVFVACFCSVQGQAAFVVSSGRHSRAGQAHAQAGGKPRDSVLSKGHRKLQWLMPNWTHWPSTEFSDCWINIPLKILFVDLLTMMDIPCQARENLCDCFNLSAFGKENIPGAWQTPQDSETPLQSSK